MTASGGPALHDLHDDYGDRVAFISLYVREAHPGDRFPQPHDVDQKLHHAREYRDRDSIPWPVVVDDVDGTLHRQLDPRPHAAYVMAHGRHGRRPCAVGQRRQSSAAGTRCDARR